MNESVDQALFALDQEGTQREWHEKGILNRKMKLIDKQNFYPPSNIWKIKDKKLFMLFMQIFANEDSEGKVFWKTFEEKFYKKHTTKKHIKTAIENNLLDIVEETSDYIIFDYKKLLSYLKEFVDE